MIRRNFLTLLAIGLMLAPSGMAQSDKPLIQGNQSSIAGEARESSEESIFQESKTDSNGTPSQNSENPLCDYLSLPSCGPCGNLEPEESGNSPVYWDGGYGFWIGTPEKDGLSLGYFSNYQHFGLC